VTKHAADELCIQTTCTPLIHSVVHLMAGP